MAARRDDKTDRVTEIEERIGMFGPGSWARIGLVVLVIVAAILLVGNYLGGDRGSLAYPGSPAPSQQGSTSSN